MKRKSYQHVSDPWQGWPFFSRILTPDCFPNRNLAGMSGILLLRVPKSTFYLLGGYHSGCICSVHFDTRFGQNHPFLEHNILVVDLPQSTRLRSRVREAYSAAAEKPNASHPFPVGRDFAESLGYPGDLLDHMPSACVDAFAGVSNVVLFADLLLSATVLDLGCGAGLDSLIAAQRIGPGGRVLGLDFSESMLFRARQAGSQLGRENVLFCRGDAENLPLEDETIDAVLVNGIFNLNPARAAIFCELGRVVKPGGVVYLAEIILRQPLPPEVRASEVDWFA